MTTHMLGDDRFAYSQRVRYMESFAEAVLDLPDERDETISLAYGDADPAHFPVAALVGAMTHMMQSRVDDTLNYAPPDAGLLALIHARMSRHNVNLPLSQYITVNGSSQIIGLLPQVLCDPGDVIIVEGPTFLGAVETFHNFGVRIETIPVRVDGMDLDVLEARLAQLRNDGVAVKCIYTIPTFQNPTGTLMPLANRRRLLTIAATYGVLIVEDDAYGDLHFNSALPPKLIALDTHDSVLYVGTFSKILAPGVRMAWACGPKALIQRLHRWKAEGSNGPFMTRLVAQVSRDGWLDRHIDHLNTLYASKCAVLLAGIRAHFPSDVRYVVPQGGFFVYVYLPADLPVAKVMPAALARNVSFLPGTTCYANGEGTHEMRLSFSYQSAERIAIGIERLGAALAAVRAGQP
jgi:2-aminoadipate transaminase